MAFRYTVVDAVPSPSPCSWSGSGQVLGNGWRVLQSEGSRSRSESGGGGGAVPAAARCASGLNLETRGGVLGGRHSQNRSTVEGVWALEPHGLVFKSYPSLLLVGDLGLGWNPSKTPLFHL